MIRIFVRHPVNNYAAWRKVYDDFDATRKKMGVRGHGVYRGVDDANDITVWHDFDSVEAAKTFGGSNELKSAMQSAGVAGVPTIWVTNHA